MNWRKAVTWKTDYNFSLLPASNDMWFVSPDNLEVSMSMRTIALLSCLTLALAGCAGSSEEHRLATMQVDLQKYQGTWYEQASSLSSLASQRTFRARSKTLSVTPAQVVGDTGNLKMESPIQAKRS